MLDSYTEARRSDVMILTPKTCTEARVAMRTLQQQITEKSPAAGAFDGAENQSRGAIAA
jgi:hypothetical protein